MAGVRNEKFVCNEASTSKAHKTERSRKKQRACDTNSLDDCYVASTSTTSEAKHVLLCYVLNVKLFLISCITCCLMLKIIASPYNF